MNVKTELTKQQTCRLEHSARQRCCRDRVPVVGLAVWPQVLDASVDAVVHHCWCRRQHENVVELKKEACTAHTENREGVADKGAALRHTVEHSVDLQAGGGGLHMPQTLVQTPAAANALSCVWSELASAIRARTHNNHTPIRYATPAP